MSTTHQLEFNNAMTDFKIMFPDMVSNEHFERDYLINKNTIFLLFMFYFNNMFVYFVAKLQESEVIEAILRINKGSVESTIDALLSISQDNQVNKNKFNL